MADEKQKVDEIVNWFPDEGIRSYLFEGIKRFDEPSALYKLLHNMVNLSFLYAYSCFLTLRNNFEGDKKAFVEKYINKGNANSRRVMKMMLDVYKDYALTNELIQFVMMDIYFDFQLGRDSFLQDCFPDCCSGKKVNLGEIFALTNDALASSRDSDDFDSVKQKVMVLRELFPFLHQDIKLEYNPELNMYWFRNAFDQKKSSYTFGVIKRVKQGKKRLSYLFLSEISEDSAKFMKADESTFFLCKFSGECVEDEEGVLDSSMCLGERDAFVCNVCPEILDEAKKKDAQLLERVYSVNYKYIKNLGLAIVDEIGNEGYAGDRNAFASIFRTKYPDAFVEWQKDAPLSDATILMLLIDAGPFRVLKSIIETFPDIIGYRIFKNLKQRFGNLMKEELKAIDSPESFKNEAKKIEEKICIGNIGYKYFLRSHTVSPRAVAVLILSAISVVDKDLADSFSPSEVKIGMDLQMYLKNSADDNEKREKIRRLICTFLLQFYCFYNGLIAYGKEKQKFRACADLKILTSDEIREFQNKAEESFGTEARKACSDLKSIGAEKSAGKLFRALFEFCRTLDHEKVMLLLMTESKTKKSNEANNTSAQGFDNDKRTALYTVLGKYSIMDVEEFSREITLDSLEDLDNDYFDVAWWSEQIKKIFKFFTTGSFKDVKNENNFTGAIYPITANYQRCYEGEWGFKTSLFSLEIDANRDGNGNYFSEVNVLSEFEYAIDESYYCLPNVLRSPGGWWIDPFVINCRLFDEIFQDDKKQE